MIFPKAIVSDTLKKSKLVLFCTFLFFVVDNVAYPLALPRSLQGKPVYYEHSDQIPNWSCGYNVLYNACLLEKKFGFMQQHADLGAFKTICTPYLERMGKRSDESSSNKMLDELAKRLRLQLFSYLHINKNGQVEYISSEAVRISYPKGSSKAHIDQLFQQAYKKQSDDRMRYLKSHIHAYGNCSIAHFACQVVSRGVDHAILLSVVKEGLQLKLYIYDNMNALISEYSDTKQYIDFLMKEFMIAGCDVIRKPATFTEKVDYNTQRILRNRRVQQVVRGLSRVLRYSRFFSF